MIPLSATSRISAILKAHPDALDAIVSISPHFGKLRNPILRKLLAPRVTVAEAARIGKCSVEDFFEKLSPLGFEVEKGAVQVNPDFGGLRPGNITTSLDVRQDIEQEKDPLLKITDAVNQLRPGESLEILSPFVPYPLIRLMKKRGCAINVQEENGIVFTWITIGEQQAIDKIQDAGAGVDFDELLQRYQGKMQEINVRDLPMPQPMLKILASLETLPPDQALFVRHKKIPVMLLPELKERGFKFAFSEEESGILMIICKI